MRRQIESAVIPAGNHPVWPGSQTPENLLMKEENQKTGHGFNEIQTWWNPGKCTMEIPRDSPHAPSHISSGVSGPGHRHRPAINWTAGRLSTMPPPPAVRMKWGHKLLPTTTPPPPPVLHIGKERLSGFLISYTVRHTYPWCNRIRNYGHWRSRTFGR
jgi:hypothetical protein